MKTRNKQGISLIVLVITIIVMIILAASVVITLSNSGIINRASEATGKTNRAQIEQYASIVWADAFMDGLRGDALKDAVLDKLKNKNEEEISRINDTIFRITYILHKPFTNKSYDEFLNELDFSIIGDVRALEELAGVIGKLLGTLKKPNTP